MLQPLVATAIASMTAGNDANASNAALANAAGALPPWQRLCSLTTRVSRGIDALIDGVLQVSYSALLIKIKTRRNES
jgi:hypothetical protein